MSKTNIIQITKQVDIEELRSKLKELYNDLAHTSLMNHTNTVLESMEVIDSLVGMIADNNNEATEHNVSMRAQLDSLKTEINEINEIAMKMQREFCPNTKMASTQQMLLNVTKAMREVEDMASDEWEG